MTGTETAEPAEGRSSIEIPDERCDAAMLIIARTPGVSTARVVDEHPCALLPNHAGDHVSPDGKMRWPNEDEDDDQDDAVDDQDADEDEL